METYSRFLFAAVLIILCCLSSAICQSLVTGFATIEGRRVYYEVQGQGPALVLIHGFSLDTRMWDPQFDAFAQSYRVVRYDISGYGRSTAPDTLISSSNELAALLKALGIDKATVVGMSMGGGVAINFTLEHPEMVEALITVGSTLGGYSMREPRATRTQRVFSLARDSGLAIAKEVWLHDPFLTPMVDTSAIRAKIRRIITDWSGIQLRNPAMARFLPIHPLAITRLEEIRVPTLAIVGELDDPNPLAVADTIAARVPGAKKVTIHGSGHLLNLEQPDEFNKLVLDFLRQNMKR